MARRKTPPKKMSNIKGRTLYVTHNLVTTAPKTTIQQIKALQKTTKLLIPKLPFGRQYGQFKIQFLAAEALQEAAEIYLTTLFTDSQKVCAHAKRVTVKPGDMKLALEIRGPQDTGYRYLEI